MLYGRNEPTDKPPCRHAREQHTEIRSNLNPNRSSFRTEWYAVAARGGVRTTLRDNPMTSRKLYERLHNFLFFFHYHYFIHLYINIKKQ